MCQSLETSAKEDNNPMVVRYWILDLKMFCQNVVYASNPR